MGAPVFDQLTLVHDDDLVKVKYGIELVRDRDKGMMREGRAKEALDMSIRRRVKARGVLLATHAFLKMGGNKTYLLVASSMITTLALSFLSIARAKQNN